MQSYAGLRHPFTIRDRSRIGWANLGMFGIDQVGRAGQGVLSSDRVFRLAIMPCSASEPRVARRFRRASFSELRLDLLRFLRASLGRDERGICPCWRATTGRCHARSAKGEQ